ncbi:hypothetical protein COT03_01700 [Candidatus Shapirobacteria bacterium CG07_land_8_20_14_0_80_39_18]|uniref:DUF948 domain-containing protein n=1 Tax=Candidatus Shapirobacteria bacterium CG07_land_8_20_14_0_80_39_18 TaxID=1974882 RepID=A0A2M6YR95_9BACT|nr:MAG: hypothetical protein COT03_01700 [Candidatus Shapirobacteria bacterium CG07_land_8_20_14_0_80_39_18]
MQIPYINQILLLVVVTTLTTVLTIAGIEVIHILRELRISVKTFNKVLEDSHTISSSVAKPIAGMSGFIMGIKSGADVIGTLLSKGKGEK